MRCGMGWWSEVTWPAVKLEQQRLGDAFDFGVELAGGNSRLCIPCRHSRPTALRAIDTVTVPVSEDSKDQCDTVLEDRG